MPTNGQYVINLSGATNNNYPFGEGVYAIGGRPVIVRETDRQAPCRHVERLGCDDADGSTELERR